MKINVLDHGYVELVEAWGTGKDGLQAEHDGADPADYEVGIIEAARQSTQGAFRGWESAACSCVYGRLDTHVPDPVIGKPERHMEDCAFRLNLGDKRLLAYLHDHKHATPFEFAGMVIEVQAPIFVFREGHRHRTQSYNEASARYAPLPDLYYMPDQFVTQERVFNAANSKNKQEQGESHLLDVAASVTGQWLQNLDRVYQECEALYQAGLQMGIPKELARLCMPVGHYSKMRALANLRNWLGFLTLRSDPAAQWEIRQFSEAVGVIISKTFPQTWKLFAGQ